MLSLSIKKHLRFDIQFHWSTKVENTCAFHCTRQNAKTLPACYRYICWLLLDSDCCLLNGILKLFCMYYSKIKRNCDNCRYCPYDDLRNCDLNWFKQIGLASWVNISEWFVWKENEELKNFLGVNLLVWLNYWNETDTGETLPHAQWFTTDFSTLYSCERHPNLKDTFNAT